MRIKIVLSLALASLSLAFGLGCWKSSAPQEGKVVAVATLMSHPALDQVASGMKEELARLGWREGVNITYIENNANQQMSLVPTIANNLAARQPDVFVAITTPMAQAVKKAFTGRIVFAAVTDPVGAGVIEDINRPQAGITGTSDAWPYEDQLALIREILPNAKVLGVLYNPGEAASQYGIKEIRKSAPKYGFELVEGSVNSVTETLPVAENLAGRVDALFLSSDNTVIAGAVGAFRAAVAAHKPMFVGDSGTVAKGGLAAVSVGYKELGHATGKLVDQTLRGKDKLPVVVGRGMEVYVNRKAAEMMGVQLPASVLKKAVKVYETIEQ